MIKYALNMDVPKLKHSLGCKTPTAFLGSCFTEHLYKQLTQYQMPIRLGPNGTIFNPMSLVLPLQMAVQKTNYTADDICMSDGMYFSRCHHGSYAEPNPLSLLERIQSEHIQFEQALKQTQHIIVTFGSAYVYEHIEQQFIYANCHKLPGQHFRKYLLSVDQIVKTWSDIIIAFETQWPQIKWLFTVSPVKHLKDGIHQNNLSKSTLLLAIDQLQQLHQHIDYFPSYELLQDDLRDYRFYSEDGAHPTPQAIHYIVEQFKAVAFNLEAQNYMALMDKYLLMQNHNRLHHQSDSALKLDQQLAQIKQQLLDEFGVQL